jgi:hypothetical protein
VNKLTTLEGCPKYIGDSFYCGYNALTTLEGCPSYVGGYFECRYNHCILTHHILGNVQNEICFNHQRIII